MEFIPLTQHENVPYMVFLIKSPLPCESIIVLTYGRDYGDNDLRGRSIFQN